VSGVGNREPAATPSHFVVYILCRVEGALTLLHSASLEPVRRPCLYKPSPTSDLLPASPLHLYHNVEIRTELMNRLTVTKTTSQAAAPTYSSTSSVPSSFPLPLILHRNAADTRSALVVLRLDPGDYSRVLHNLEDLAGEEPDAGVFDTRVFEPVLSCRDHRHEYLSHMPVRVGARSARGVYGERDRCKGGKDGWVPWLAV
jgi:hypothetical protein